MPKFGFQLCPLISRDPKHVIYSLQVVIRLSVLVAEVASGEWGAGSEKKKGGKGELFSPLVFHQNKMSS